jgi:hypothetical protein
VREQAAEVLVVQSSPGTVPAWVDRCMASVRSWAGEVAYEHLDDAFLDLAPGWVHDACDSFLPVTDVARLVLLQRRLAEGWSRVVWLDADVLVFDGPLVDVSSSDADVAVCVERWVTGAPGGGLQAVPFVCNAALSATDVDALLDVTLDRVRAGDVQPRSLGPDLLTPLHRASPSPFGEIRGVSVASPHVVRGEPGAWELLVSSLPWPVGALNLCWSVAGDELVVERFVDRLLA